jgi:endonuclease/exonuclease/phosphatase family metal-dependent hydrolase
VTASLCLASYNIHKAVGTDRRRDPHRIAKVIAEIAPDIVALQEVDLRFGRRTGLLNLEALEEETGLVAVPVDRRLEAHGFHGNLILARGAEIEEVHHLALPGLEPRGALLADLRLDGRKLRVIGAHLGLLPQSRLSQARAILNRIEQLDDRPMVLMGDLNEWRTGRASSLGPLAEFFHSAPIGRSFPARYPMVPLDRMMACRRGRIDEFAVHDTALARVASDHLPIKGRLLLATE